MDASIRTTWLRRVTCSTTIGCLLALSACGPEQTAQPDIRTPMWQPLTAAPLPGPNASQSDQVNQAVQQHVHRIAQGMRNNPYGQPDQGLQQQDRPQQDQQANTQNPNAYQQQAPQAQNPYGPRQAAQPQQNRPVIRRAVSWNDSADASQAAPLPLYPGTQHPGQRPGQAAGYQQQPQAQQPNAYTNPYPAQQPQAQPQNQQQAWQSQNRQHADQSQVLWQSDDPAGQSNHRRNPPQPTGYEPQNVNTGPQPTGPNPAYQQRPAKPAGNWHHSAQPATTIQQPDRDQFKNNLIKQLIETTQRADELDLRVPLRESLVNILIGQPGLNGEQLAMMDETAQIEARHWLQTLDQLRETLNSDQEFRRIVAQLNQQLSRSKRLRLNNPNLCISVRGFGDFTTFPTNTFLAGRLNKVIVYTEVENFKPIKDDTDMFTTRLKMEVALLRENDGTTIWQSPPVEANDRSRNRRRDFYVVQIIDLPANLPVGRYQMKIRITDMSIDQVDAELIPIRIVGDRRLVLEAQKSNPAKTAE